MDNGDCPLCSIDLKETEFSSAEGCGIWKTAKRRGEYLVVPRRHVSAWDELREDERTWLWIAVNKAVAAIRAEFSPIGFSIDFNIGLGSEQNKTHFHLRIVPRFEEASHSSAFTINSRNGLETLLDQQRLIKGGDDPFLPHLVRHMDGADACDIAVAFLLESGARCIVEHLKDFLDRGGRARILVSDYLDVTDPVALRLLHDLDGDLALKVYETRANGFHLKSYVFLRGADGVAFVGSSNLSRSALTTHIEWNYKVVSSHDHHGFQEIRDGFERLFAAPTSVSINEGWIEEYERRRVAPRLGEASVVEEIPEPKIEPHSIQLEALAALGRTREEGFSAGLVVLATGLGKTWLAALDTDRPEFRRILFVAHREEILDQAIRVFRRIRPNASIGRLAGDRRETDTQLVFASIQTLGRLSHLSRFRANDFDYIVVDEFHHAAAGTYRRVIDYFRPKFLLGLTATPDRTDGADLLALCQENLVFDADIRRGIEGGLLCPFQYFGIADDVDYTNIPWRSAQFDITELTAAVATEARARNALEQLRKHGGRRCIAFCCSQIHADFMASFFVQEGVRAVAVHSGPNSAPRATSLEKLRDGELDVIFAVDMFNEGVDVPSIDTVLMLRPTESTIIWLQQLGRGLRKYAFKERLVVIDYIGNHRAFLTKLQGMSVILGAEAESRGRQREVLEAIRDERVTLPAGCEITYETSVIDILEYLVRPSRTEEVMETFYRDFEDRNGVRPTAVEVYHAGLNPRSNSERTWFGFVERMGGLNANEKASLAAAQGFFTSLEKTEASRSYKIVLLLALFDGDDLRATIAIEELTRSVAALAKRMHRLEDDFSVDLSSSSKLQRLLVAQPIEAFVNAKGMDGVPYFKFDGKAFSFDFQIPDLDLFGALLREILDWRLAQYLSRTQVTDTVCRVSRNQGGQPILFLPSNEADLRLPEGPLEIEVNGEVMEASVRKIAINVVRRPGASINELPAILSGWFGEDVGLPGRSDRVRFRKTGEAIAMEPFGVSMRSGTKSGLRRWERYLREEIPAAFGLQFNPATWNVGFVVSPPHIFLLVTLTKDDMNPDHQYADHFISADEFSWQSQNQTTQDSKRGLLLRDHQKMRTAVHLLIRPTKKTGNRPTPFVYCGEVDFASWEGNRPITIRWRLREPVPATLRAGLKVPA
jgi:superfamily II DNA or RNA helicase/HKD family nuclease